MTDFSKELVNYAIIRLDGAWFRFVMEKYGAEEAVELDAEVWREWTMRVSWKIKKSLRIPRDQQFTSIKDIFNVLNEVGQISGDLMGFQGNLHLDRSNLISRISNCQYWESIKKAGFDQFAESGMLCSKVHVASYEGLLKGLFPNLEFSLNQTKRIPSGNSCCKVIITPQL